VPLAVDESRTRCAYHARTAPAARARPGGVDRPASSRPGGRRRSYRQLTAVGQWHARTYAARPDRDGPFLVPRLADVSLPPGYQAVVDRDEALALFGLLPATAGLRQDSWSTRWAIWQALCDHLHDDGLAVVGQQQLGQRAEFYAGCRVPRTTVGRHLRALEDDCAIHVAVRGASKEVLKADRHRAPVYVLPCKTSPGHPTNTKPPSAPRPSSQRQGPPSPRPTTPPSRPQKHQTLGTNMGTPPKGPHLCATQKDLMPVKATIFPGQNPTLTVDKTHRSAYRRQISQ
jgi:hypothetical protein